jgi:methyltransferase (TIGR00027 family)
MAETRPLRLFIATRSRFTEDSLAEAYVDGVRQYVLLGAGLDTFAYERARAFKDLTIFEIDHPATQAWKRERLAAGGIQIPASLTHAPIDFERDDLGTVLGRQLDVERPVLFWWLGVTPYLTVEAVTATLSTLGALPHSAVVLDHGAPNPAASAETQSWMEERRRRVASLGDPWITQFAPDELARLLHECGFEATHLEDEVALIRRLVDRPAPSEPRVTHLALAAKGGLTPLGHAR